MNSGWPSQRFSDARCSTVAHDGGVEADAGVEAEEAPVDLAEPDRPEVAGVDAAGEQLDGRDRVVGQADRAGEHVGRAAGQHAERGVGAGDAGGDLVERAVAAEADDDVDAAAGGVVGEAGGVAAPVRLDELDVVVARSAGGARRRCCGPSPTTRTSSRRAGSASAPTVPAAPSRRHRARSAPRIGDRSVVGNNERP